jgi:hypothetical protein
MSPLRKRMAIALSTYALLGVLAGRRRQPVPADQRRQRRRPARPVHRPGRGPAGVLPVTVT